MVSCGIPACYVLPPPSIASGSAKFPVGAHFNVADVVKCTGRIQVDRSGDRFLVVQHIGEFIIHAMLEPASDAYD